MKNRKRQNSGISAVIIVALYLGVITGLSLRARNIKPDFYKNEKLSSLPVETRLLFPGLWCLADREGRLEDRPARIKAEIFPYDDYDVDCMLDQLQPEFIIRYEVNGGRYIQILNFLKHQHPHINEKSSEIPPVPYETLEEYTLFDGYGASTVQAPYKYNSNRADSLNLNPESPLSLNPNPEKRENRKIFNRNSKEYLLAARLRYQRIKVTPQAIVPDDTPQALQEWSQAFHKLLNQGVDPYDIMPVIDWCMVDGFWQSRVKDAVFFCKHFATILLRMLGDPACDTGEKRPRPYQSKELLEQTALRERKRQLRELSKDLDAPSLSDCEETGEQDEEEGGDCCGV